MKVVRQFDTTERSWAGNSKELPSRSCCKAFPRGKQGVGEAGQILGCPQVLSGRWAGDDGGFCWC